MKIFTPFIFLLLLLSTFIITSCEKADELIAIDKEELHDSLKLFQSEILSTKAMTGSNEGAKFDHQYSIFNSANEIHSANDLLHLDNVISETSFTFLPGRDSVIVNGIVNVYSEFDPSLSRINWRKLEGNNLKLQYKFENGQFLVDLSEYHNIEKDWLVLGYGDSKSFSIYVNYKYLFYFNHIGSWTELVEFVSPSFSVPSEDEVWSEDFFRLLPQWTPKGYYSFLTMSNLPTHSKIIEEVKRYDFKVQG